MLGRVIVFLAVIFLVAGCDRRDTTPPPGPPQRLYTGNGFSNNLANRGKIFIFMMPFSAASTPAVTDTSTGASTALEEFAFDSLGRHAFLSACGNPHQVLVFNLPITATSAPAFAIPAAGPDGIALDSAGNLYVDNDCNVVTDYINVFNPPFSSSSTPSVTVNDAANITFPQEMFVDHSNHLYVGQCDSTKQILQYNLPLNNASTSAVTVTIAGGQCATGIAVDYLTNQLFVSDSFINKIYIFNLPISSSSTPAVTITTSNASQAWWNVAFDAAGNLYASDGGTSMIDVFVPPFSTSSNPTFSFTAPGMDFPWALAFGP